VRVEFKTEEMEVAFKIDSGATVVVDAKVVGGEYVEESISWGEGVVVG